MFKKLLGALGVGAPTVDTVLVNPVTGPGRSLQGQVNLVGGSFDVEIEHIAVGLVTRIEVEAGGVEDDAVVEFHRREVSRGLRLGEGQTLSLPFELAVPWETPITDVLGQRLHGMTMGLRTEVSIRGAVDRGDLDPVFVEPLPVQRRILEAFGELGFVFKGADLEHGRLYGVAQQLPFFQEIEFFAARRYAHSVNEVELTFVVNERGVDVVLELDKRSGMFTSGHDSFGHHHVAHTDAGRNDWAAIVDGWVREAMQRRGPVRQHTPRGHDGGESFAEAVADLFDVD